MDQLVHFGKQFRRHAARRGQSKDAVLHAAREAYFAVADEGLVQ